jgi:hypothetical protein
VLGGNGATGISSERLVERGKLRLVASKMPPALMLRAVANSRKSFPSWSTPRTKMGIDKGRRWCFRRSDADLVIVRFPVRLGAHHVPNTKKPATQVEIYDKNFELSYLRINVKLVYNKISAHLISKCGNLLRLSRKLLAPIIDFILLFS